MTDIPILERLVAAAVQAPSSHNTQPWRFGLADGAIDVMADRGRALPVNDPHDRELTVSGGCAVAAIEAAAHALGLEPRCEALPDGADGDRLARMHIAGQAAAAVPATTAVLPERWTHRGDVAADPPGAGLQSRLVRHARALDVDLRVLAGADRTEVARLIDEGDRAQWNDPRWRRELALWMRAAPHVDGLALPRGIAPLTRAVVRVADLGGAVGPRDAAAALNAPWLAVLATRADGPANWLAAGRALEAILLEAAREGFQAAYFNQPLQVDALRPALARLCGGSPQVMLRLGRPGSRPPPTARRPLADVLVAARPAGAAEC